MEINDERGSRGGSDIVDKATVLTDIFRVLWCPTVPPIETGADYCVAVQVLLVQSYKCHRT